MPDNATTDRQMLGQTRENKPEERHRARLTIAHHARDADECRRLLEMLGLDAKN